MILCHYKIIIINIKLYVFKFTIYCKNVNND